MKIEIKGDYIELQQLIKLADIASAGGEAKQMIQDGIVQVNGETETRRSRKIRKGDFVTVNGVPDMLEIR